MFGPLRDLRQDLRHGFRMVRLRPGFTAAAVLALGLGTGAATAVFSLLEGIILRPLPYESPDRLTMLWETNTGEGLDRERLSPVNFMDYRAAPVFEDAAAWWIPEINLSDDTGQPIRIRTVETSENLFHVLGVQPAIGRAFPLDSTLYGDPLEAVISHRLWQSRFGGDREVLGRTVRLNGFSHTIVGVMPPDFHFPGDTDLWQRLRWDLAQHSRGAHFMEAVARLRPGIEVDAANRELAALGSRLATEFPQTNDGVGVRASPLAVDLAGSFRPGLFALLGASGLLLLIACINVANLLLARAATRRTEVAVRTALGASPARLLRQLLAESLVLAGIGTLLGLLVAAVSVRTFLAWTPIEIPRAGDIRIDMAVLAFAAGLTGLTVLVFGLVPALIASRTDLRTTLSESPRGSAGGLRSRGRHLLVIAEVALAVALLAGAGLLIRTVDALLRQDSGVTAPGAVTVDIQLPDADYDDWSRVEQFYSRLMSDLRAQPGITAAGASNFLPLDVGWRIPFTVVGAPAPRPEDRPMAQYHTVDDGWFDATGVPLLAGRAFASHDHADAPGAVIVNRTLAERTWPGRDPIGQQLTVNVTNIGPLGRRIVEPDVHRVVGVVADTRNVSLQADPEPAIYFPVRQFPFRQMHIVMRGPAGTAEMLATLRDLVRGLDPRLPLGETRDLQRVLASPADPPRFVMLLMSIFALLALTLTAIGIYGILSYAVTQRQRELGIRLALGARPREVVALVLREGMAVAALGAALGLAAAIAGGRLLAGLLYGVRPADPATLAAVTALVLLVAAAACAAPGRRAARTDPAQTLRGG